MSETLAALREPSWFCPGFGYQCPLAVQTTSHNPANQKVSVQKFASGLLNSRRAALFDILVMAVLALTPAILCAQSPIVTSPPCLLFPPPR